MNVFIDLENSWYEFLRNVNTEDVHYHPAVEIYKIIARAYGNSSRFYHNLTHIKDVLQSIQLLHKYGQDLTSLKFAAWFHDIVYNPKWNNNEAKSAKFARVCLQKLSVDESIIHRVSELILLTQHHRVDSNDIDGQILLDADLAILGSDWSKYRLYAQNIRREYSWVSDDNYILARKAILAKFLARPQIYFFLEELEVTARQNMLYEYHNINKKAQLS
ncbi:HD domain-containing protein [Calothrix sp. NIES-3974]|uniref:HD domain-containing protein n=1 Tax=Calothrix sp. NIES-3974 TaxID=2005462 RepID=UPI000B5F2331|nr:hypothetical protein [Calothrix sp. NIES-3974]BAZ07199.1 hypothetical protein NIES3974_38620 [Calothrix sp. NIES-3974]